MEGEKPRFYLSFPITLVRDNAEARREIDKFRALMRRKFIAFDPLTMDERVLKGARLDGDYYIIYAESRWLLPPEVEPAVRDEAELYPMAIPRDQVEEVLIDIDNIIRFRDFRYVLQADAVAVYRPFMYGKFHRGIFSEIIYASNTAHKRVFIYNPPDDEANGSPFNAGFGPVEPNFEKFVESIERFAERLSSQI